MPTTTTEPHPTSAHSRPTDRPRAAGVVRVVIADDHPVYRDGVIRALMESGRYEIVGEAGDGETALRLIEERRPDVALLDLRMPVLDALGVLRRLSATASVCPSSCCPRSPSPRSSTTRWPRARPATCPKSAPREEILVALDGAARGGRVVQGSGAAPTGGPRWSPPSGRF